MDGVGANTGLWCSMADGLENEVGVKKAYYFKHLLACESGNDIDLHRAILKVLSVGATPRIDYDDGYDGLVDTWYRKDESKLLDEARGTHLRYQGVDAVIFGSATAFWPPPVELVVPGTAVAGDASCCWEIRFEADPEVEVLQDLLKKGKDVGANSVLFRKGFVLG